LAAIVPRAEAGQYQRLYTRHGWFTLTSSPVIPTPGLRVSPSRHRVYRSYAYAPYYYDAPVYRSAYYHSYPAYYDTGYYYSSCHHYSARGWQFRLVSDAGRSAPLGEDLCDYVVGRCAFRFTFKVEDDPVAQCCDGRFLDIGTRDVIAVIEQSIDFPG